VSRSEPRAQALALALAVGSPPGTVLDVTWDAPSTCPDDATARDRIRTRVADRPAGRDVQAIARVRELEDGSWQVEVELRTEQGTATRTLQAATCEEALTATAVVVAIAVDPTPIGGPETPVAVPPPPSSPGETTPEPLLEPPAAVDPPTRVPAEAAEAEPSPTTTAPARADAGGRSRWPLGIAVSVRGGLDYGALPSPAGHVAGAVGLLGRRWIVQAGPVHRVRTEASVALPRPAGGRFRLTAAQLGAGPRLAWGAFELPLWAGLELGAIWARGTGEVDPLTVRRLWTAAVASVGVGWAPRDALALHVGVEGVVPLLRPTFTLGDAARVLTVGSAAVRAWLGVTGRFSL
jgi:hypothetical protein